MTPHICPIVMFLFFCLFKQKKKKHQWIKLQSSRGGHCIEQKSSHMRQIYYILFNNRIHTHKSERVIELYWIEAQECSVFKVRWKAIVLGMIRQKCIIRHDATHLYSLCIAIFLCNFFSLYLSFCCTDTRNKIT